MDVNDPTNPIILGSGPLVGYAMRALTYAGNYAVVISGWGGGGGGGYLNIYGEVPRYLKICQDSCNSGVLLATTSSSVPINLSKGSTMDLVACYNVANDCSDASGNVTTSATWSEGGNATISLDPSINPALLRADNVGTEGISASYLSQTASITFNVFCNDVARCNSQGEEVCIGGQVNVAGPDACGNVNFSCPGKKSCGMEIKNFREINP